MLSLSLQLFFNFYAETLLTELWRNCQNEAIAEFCNAKTRQIQEITEALEVSSHLLA